MRLIEIVKNVSPNLINGMNLMGLMQGLPMEEMGYTPLIKGTKESVRVDQAVHRFGRDVVYALQKYAKDQMEFYGRCKRASVLFDWVSGVKLDQIENAFSSNQYFGRIEYGDIRRFADLTRFHLQSASNILAVLLLDKNPQAELEILLKQLEIGLPPNAIDLLRIPVPLTRGEYLSLATIGIRNPEEAWAVSPESLITCLGKRRADQLERFRPAATG
jgi:helicase